MTGPRDLSSEWAAVFAAVYTEIVLGSTDLTDSDRDEVARTAATIADQAVAALHRVRGGGEHG